MTQKSGQSIAWKPAVLRMFPPSRRYLVGVSGGRDSIALLNCLLGNGYRKLVVCHFDHQLRGQASRADARFVARLADAKGLDFETAAVDVRAVARNEKQSIETASRSARYRFFAEVARRRRCRTIFLGHHADDAVETFLLNLFRGAGAQGQRSMREISTRTIDGVELTIVRPLLGVWRSEIDNYVTTRRLRFREDATNEDLEPLRNRLRHRVIPFINAEVGRDVRKPLRRASIIGAEEDALLDSLLPSVTSELSTKKLRAMPIALQRRLIARWLRVQRIADVGFEMIESVRSLVDLSAGPAKVNLTGDRHARRRTGSLFIEPAATR